ncbi:class I SAM-dependent methyltransferase [Zarconia navalis]|nr:class I SAM-dependent methyltransferase [Zarconia navalis]
MPSDPRENEPKSPDRAIVKAALQEKLKGLTTARGELTFPCIPALLEDYIQKIQDLLSSLGQTLTFQEIETLREAIASQLAQGFHASPNAHLIVSYQPPHPTVGLSQGVKLDVKVKVESLENHYHGWIQTREGPLFGSHADAKAIAIASELGDPADVSILDVGAGVGRNTLALARLGYPVDAIELTPGFARKLTIAAEAEEIPVRVIQGNVLDPMLRMETAHYQFAVVAEVVSHFRDMSQVRLLLAKIGDALQSGGLLLFSTFLAKDGYEPDDAARELSQTAWSYIITRSELRSAMKGLPLEILSDESVFEYEQQHLPNEAWPPTPWFPNWTRGRDVFPTEASPMELRWILCKRR